MYTLLKRQNYLKHLEAIKNNSVDEIVSNHVELKAALW